MPAGETNAEALALQALVWTLGDSTRATRLLDLTGLDPAELRARAGEPALLAATLGFLEGHEPDLIACAEALAVTPGALVGARAELDRA
ncbi:DUF3572 domain-containing protein [Sphingomonas psychrotolerans]|uniref:DUF3572 domain-containing protein n=1 Tax=Sphingomonas psychrotolerans TaxID=1327635 RepID=A0ABU3N635_9SPHN|nr:DUF3572 family protein [Sphingomonas psychrotolerans]MDT8759990.1 DUF3572 domain-containing protein [Sphingomonas psychrotolerans]